MLKMVYGDKVKDNRGRLSAPVLIYYYYAVVRVSPVFHCLPFRCAWHFYKFILLLLIAEFFSLQITNSKTFIMYVSRLSKEINKHLESSSKYFRTAAMLIQSNGHH